MKRRTGLSMMAIVGHVLLLGLPGDAESQAVADRRLGAAARSLELGSTIDVAAGTAIASGRFWGVVSDSLRIGKSASEQRFALSTIDSLWVRRRYGSKGAAIGGVIGGVAFAGMFIAYMGSSCGSFGNCLSDYTQATAVGFASGGLGGAAIGSVIGWFIESRRRVYP